jgi:hypothetical protein
MKRLVLVVALALVASGAMVGPAQAKDEFEDGFKTELGAIAARSAVGLGVGVVSGILHGGVAYDGYYAHPAPVYRPYYRERVVYVAPPPPPPVYYRVEKRHYRPYCPPPPPPVAHHYHHHDHYYTCR